jgi:hypothetical protein
MTNKRNGNNSGWKAGGKRALLRPRHRQDITTIHLTNMVGENAIVSSGSQQAVK